MLRLLGILTLGNLLLGGRRGRRAVRRGLLFGALLGLFASRNFDTEKAAEDVRNTARNARRAAREAARAARDAARAVRREIHDARRAEHRRETEERLEEIRARAEERRAARAAAAAAPAATAAPEAAAPAAPAACLPPVGLPASAAPILDDSKTLVEDLERDARTAAMAADVPMIEFPEEESDKYYASRKYGYV